jgi:hypothetical protein
VLTPRGYADATTDRATVARWAARWPSANVGIAAGLSLVLVDVDVDVRGAEHALHPLDALAELGSLPETLSVASGGGGTHLYFSRPTGRELSFRRDRFPAGVEVKLGNGGLCAPPSLHPDTGERYAWSSRLPIATAPEWLLELLRSSICPASPPAAPIILSGAGTRYGLAALERKLALVVGAGEGSRRNTLNGAAYALGQLVAGGQLDEAATAEALEQAAAQTGLPVAEIRATIRHGLTDGQQRPWYPERVA